MVKQNNKWYNVKTTESAMEKHKNELRKMKKRKTLSENGQDYQNDYAGFFYD